MPSKNPAQRLRDIVDNIDATRRLPMEPRTAYDRRLGPVTTYALVFATRATVEAGEQHAANNRAPLKYREGFTRAAV